MRSVGPRRSRNLTLRGVRETIQTLFFCFVGGCMVYLAEFLR